MQSYHNSIFWVETEKISPNPYQPRREFDERALADLADSIRQYGVLQPLVVTRREMETESGLSVQYELIAGERRLRASRIAGLPQVPVIIRAHSEDAKVKLELAIIENLQREDLNPIDRAMAFEKLAKEFGFNHAEIGKKMGKSREYVSNSLRLLALPDDIRQALIEKRITEGHTRPLMMLTDKPAEQMTLFKELVVKRLSVRETERIARSLAAEKVRKKELEIDPTIQNYENKFAESLGTRVHIEKRDVGGKIVIDFFSPADLDMILNLVKNNQGMNSSVLMERYLQSTQSETPIVSSAPTADISQKPIEQNIDFFQPVTPHEPVHGVAQNDFHPEPEIESIDAANLDDRSQTEIDRDENSNDDDLYNLNIFNI